MSTPSLSDNYKTWDVKLIWNVNFPSKLFAPGTVTPESFEIYGVDRSGLNISRPLTRIHSLEQGNQGYQDGMPDMRVTIFDKESGESFEEMRRISASKIPFDVSLTLAADVADKQLEDNEHEGIWIKGYEEFLGCRVTGERTNYAIAEMPLREFECMALRHLINANKDFDVMIEGDGTYATILPKKVTPLY